MNKPSSDELIFAKIEDKINFCKTKNKITYTDFFTEPEIIKIERRLKFMRINNYFFNGVLENTDRKMLFFYPEKLTLSMAITNVKSILNIIRITLPNSLKGVYKHKDYLSAIMKFGIVREKFGDIIVYEEGADIIIQKENAEYFKNNLQELIRFKKAHIEILDISEIHENKSNLEEISIIVNSMRIDNFVSEIARCSRNKAEEILVAERVMINYEIVSKNSKIVNIGDIITVRGCGRFQVKEISRKTKSDKLVVILVHNK